MSRPTGTPLPVYVGHSECADVTPGGSEPPHRHDFQEVLWFVRGEGRHHIDGAPYPIEPGTIAVIARGQVHWLERAQGLECYRLCLQDDLLQTSGLHRQVPLALFSPARGGEPLRPTGPDWALGLTLFEALAAEFSRATAHRDLQVLLALVVAMVELVERIDRANGHPAPPARGLVPAFLGLLDAHVRERHEVSFYAAQLGVSPERLCQAVQHALGKTTKQAIRERLLLEARRHLLYTDLSIKQVGGSLGFPDPQYFGKVFKESFGTTPAAYRRAARSPEPVLPDWPHRAPHADGVGRT